MVKKFHGDRDKELPMLFVQDADSNLVNVGEMMSVRVEGRTVIAHVTSGSTVTLYAGEPADANHYANALMETLNRLGLYFVAGGRSYINIEKIISIRVFDNNDMSTVVGMFHRDGVYSAWSKGPLATGVSAVLFRGPLTACIGWRDALFAELQAREKGLVIK